MKTKILISILLIIVGIIIGAATERHYLTARFDNDALQYELLAMHSRKEGAISNAINYYSVAKYIDPENPQYDYALGHIYNGLGLYDLAHDEFAQALLKKDTVTGTKFHYTLMYCVIGSMSLDRGDNETANPAFRASLELNPQFPGKLLTTYDKHKSDIGENKRLGVYKICLDGLKDSGYLKD